MRKLLRQIEAPSNMQFVGGVIKAQTLNAFTNYHQIIQAAEDEKSKIIQEAKNEAHAVKAMARVELAQELRADMQALKQQAQAHLDQLYKQSTDLCLQICKAVIAQVLEQTPDEAKLAKLIRALIKKSHGANALQLECNPNQEALVKDALAKLLAENLNMRKVVVNANAKLAPFELRIQSVKGSEIVVSLENLVALYESEIDALQRELKPVFDNSTEELT